MTPLISRLVPFIFLGFALTALAFGIILLAYLFFFGAIIGIILFLFAWIKEKFFPKKENLSLQRKGRIINAENWKKRD